MKRDTFVFHRSWWKSIKRLDTEQQALVLRYLCEYEPGTEYDFRDPVLNIVFDNITGDIDEDSRKYDEVCAKRQKAAFSRWENASASKSMQMDQEHASAHDNEVSDYYDMTSYDMSEVSNENEPPTAAATTPTIEEVNSYFALNRGSIADAKKFYQEKKGFRSFPANWKQWADEWLQRPKTRKPYDQYMHHEYSPEEIRELAIKAKE